MIDISAVLPLYKGKKYIEESIRSIQSQTLHDWELIIVSEPDNDDGSDEIVLDFASKDSRIKLIKADVKLGLAKSLNLGIASASGKYIARVDVDDPSYPERFQKQLEFMEGNPDIFLCGTLTKSVLPDRSYILDAPCDYDDLKSGLLFGCEISHCSVMFRRDEWIASNYSYDTNSLCEDYDLWTKIMFEKKIVNIPEVLVEHRWGFGNISLQKGYSLIRASRNVSRRTIENAFGVFVPEENLYLCSGWRSKPFEIGKYKTSEFIKQQAKLIADLREANDRLEVIENNSFERMLFNRFNWCCESCNLFFKRFKYEKIIQKNTQEDKHSPLVSIVMPVMNAVYTIRETIDSILLQEYKNWEFLIICDRDSNDGSTEIAEFYAFYDSRIKVIKTERKLGLSESINIGIDESNGKYIARIDADDLANEKRISAQIKFMEEHPDIGICQCYQHYFGNNAGDFIHRPECDPEYLKAKLLFFCDACHSTIMLRKEILDKYGLRYNPLSLIEDYELWSRMICVTKFATIPEVYGEYRVSFSNVSNEKLYDIQKEMCQITSNQIHEYLGIDVPENEQYVLGGYINTIFNLSEPEKAKALSVLHNILDEIYLANERLHFYDKKALKKAIEVRWRWSSEGVSWHEDLNEFEGWTMSVKNKVKHIVLSPLKAIQKLNMHLFAKNIEHVSNVVKDVDSAQAGQIDARIQYWTWDRYRRLEAKLDESDKLDRELLLKLVQLDFEKNKISYQSGEKLRIVLLFQIPSIWISWESFYEACLEDERIDCHLLLLEETFTEKSQMNGARDFLDENGIAYEKALDFDIEEYRPHVMVFQTPYDKWHRKKIHWSQRYKSMGVRIVYIPYGIEISDTEDSHKLHFEEDVILNSYRIFTFSEMMKKDYRRYCLNGKSVCSLGLPRLDFYFNNQKKDSVGETDKKTVVWKVHFPKWIDDSGKRVLVTPDMKEYLSFAKAIHNEDRVRFIFMPHPKFLEKSWGDEVNRLADEIIKVLATSDNVSICMDDDYWNSLIKADAVITDRSSVMVEAGALSVPVFYASNTDYYEPETKAIKPLIDSYYQGHNANDMLRFIEMFIEGGDPLKELRKARFAECIPYFDGKAGERIKDEILQAVIKEDNQT